MAKVITAGDSPEEIARISEQQLRILRRRRTISLVIRYFVLILVGIFMVYPLIWMVGATFKTNNEIFTTLNPIPIKPTLQG